MSSARLDGYAVDLHQEVLTKAGDDVSPRLREEAFTEIVLEYLADQNESGGAELATYESKGSGRTPASKLNAWALSGDGATLDLFVSLYRGTPDVEEIGKPEVRRHFELLAGFLKRALEGVYSKLEESSAAFEAARQVFEAKETLTSVRLFLLTDGVVRSMTVEGESVEGLEVSHVVWDLDKLSRLRPGEHEAIRLDFVNRYDGPIACLHKEDATGEYRTFLAFMPAELLARIYGEYGQRLLERNVRAFLQSRNNVNRGLQKTIREEPSRFLAYNNGLCCTAASVDVLVGDSGHARLRAVDDFQIVNGGQTTASIYHALKKEKVDVSQVVVQVKLTVISDPGRVAEIVPLISRYANSQNKVNTADFSANGPFHRQIEKLSRSIWAPAATGMDRQTHWYYERARGSYADDRSRQTTASRRREWEGQNPARQKFTKIELAKFELIWQGCPELVCLGGEKAFDRHAVWIDEHGDLAGVDGRYFERLIAKAILVRSAERLFSASGLDGYRANSVAYGLAWLAERSGRRIDLDWIWENQRIPPALADAIVAACSRAHAHIISQPGNPGEASKREACWREFKSSDICVGEAWLEELASSAFLGAEFRLDALSLQWDAIRARYEQDGRTMHDVEMATGMKWVAKRRSDLLRDYTTQTMAQLREAGGLGLKKLRGLVAITSALMRLEA